MIVGYIYLPTYNPLATHVYLTDVVDNPFPHEQFPFSATAGKFEHKIFN